MSDEMPLPEVIRNAPKTDACLKCGSTELQPGKILPRSTSWDVRFMPENASALSFKKKIKAMACSSCGYIELFLTDDK